MYTQETSQILRSLFEGNITLDDLEKAAAGISNATQIPGGESEAGKESSSGQPAVKAKGFKTSGFKSSFKRIDPAQEAEDLLRETLGGGAGGEDIDGEEMDLDGEEMDLDGEPMRDDDLDGEPM